MKKDQPFLVFSLRGDGLKQLSEIENNEVENLRFFTILKFARAFGVDPSELIDEG